MDRRRLAAQVVADFIEWSFRLMRRASADTGLSFVQLLVLRTLSTRGPMRMGAASDDLALADGVMTGVVDRLQERGLVERLRDPADRRAILIGLTPEGEAFARSTIAPYEKALETIFEGMEEEAVEQIAERIQRLARGVPIETPIETPMETRR